MPDLATATAAYQRLLEPDLLEFPLTPLDHVGIPVWQVWWTGPGGGSGGIGYGLSEERARIGALGECVEHACATTALRSAEPVEGSLVQLRSRYGDDHVVDPRLLGLPAGSDFTDDRPLHWLGMRRLRDGATVFAPAELVASSGAELSFGPPTPGWLTTPVSNGLGAGTTRDQAVAHAVLEILQRDGNGLRFRALDAGQVIDLASVTDPRTREAVDRLTAAGIHVQAKLAATDFGLPNVYVVGSAPDDDILSATACGEAVHPDRDVALGKALLEFASARARKQFMHGPLDAVRQIAPPEYARVVDEADPSAEEQWPLRAMVDWLRSREADWRPRLTETVFRQETVVRFDDLPTNPTGDGLLEDLTARLGRAGHDILVRDLSPGDQHADVHAVKVLVPGLEVETVAYQRIGERNTARLLASGRDDLVRVTPAAPGPEWRSIALTDTGQERVGGSAWLHVERLQALADGLLPLYREPSRHTAQKALAAAPPQQRRM